jgi:predicted TIM-barrel fold metal-dependent hydrolase
MAVDGVSAEVLYPTLGLKLFAIEDADLQERCCRRYNEWIAEYCAVDPARLIGVGMIPTYSMDAAVRELEFCAKQGMRGCLIWEAPDPRLAFSSSNYDPFWAAASALRMPVSLHILTGHDFSKKMHEVPQDQLGQTGLQLYRGAVNLKLYGVMDTLFEIIFSGALERFPEARIVLVESEVGWLPFVVEQWDYYFRRFRTANPLSIERSPSEYFKAQVYATFFRDPIAAHLFSWWGQDNCMWSNDYPHGNSTWPHSREVIEQTFGGLEADTLHRLLRGNAMRLYDIRLAPAATTPDAASLHVA